MARSPAVATPFHLRWMIRRDTSEVLAIERASYDEPWTAEEFDYLMGKRNCAGIVATHEDRVVGFMVYELHRKYIRLFNLAVHPDVRRCGVGAMLLARLQASTRLPRTRVEARIVETDDRGISFFRSAGFLATAVERGAFGERDGYRMEWLRE